MQKMIQVSEQEYQKLKMKAEIADDALVQLKMSLEDLRHGRVMEFDLEAS